MTMWRSTWMLFTAALFGVGTALPVSAQAPASPADDRAAVLAVVDALFDGMREKDETLLASVFHAEAELHSTGTDDQGSPVLGRSEVSLFIRNVLGADAYVDEVTFDEEVRIDGNLAMAWTPYNLFVDGNFRHCGVDLFSMVRTTSGWKVIELVDTRRTDGCDPGRRR